MSDVEQSSGMMRMPPENEITPVQRELRGLCLTNLVEAVDRMRASAEHIGSPVSEEIIKDPLGGPVNIGVRKIIGKVGLYGSGSDDGITEGGQVTAERLDADGTHIKISYDPLEISMFAPDASERWGGDPTRRTILAKYERHGVAGSYEAMELHADGGVLVTFRDPGLVTGVARSASRPTRSYNGAHKDKDTLIDFAAKFAEL